MPALATTASLPLLPPQAAANDPKAPAAAGKSSAPASGFPLLLELINAIAAAETPAAPAANQPAPPKQTKRVKDPSEELTAAPAAAPVLPALVPDVPAPVAQGPAAELPKTAAPTVPATSAGLLVAQTRVQSPAESPAPAYEPTTAHETHVTTLGVSRTALNIPAPPAGIQVRAQSENARCADLLERVLAPASGVWRRQDPIPQQPGSTDVQPPAVPQPSAQPASQSVDLAFTMQLTPLKPAAAALAPKPRKTDEIEPAPAPEKAPSALKPVAIAAGTAAPPEGHPDVSQPESPKPVLPAEPVELRPLEPPKPNSPAHEIKLEVSGAAQRVEVRLSERAGEVRVAVRTADSHLAGSLRENLPGLSSRLAENGFRTETWHPMASTGEVRRTAEVSTGNLSQDAHPDSRQHSGGQSSQQDSPRRQQLSEEQIERKDKGKDFAWFISSQQ